MRCATWVLRFACLALLATFASAAEAGRRVALVVGNGDYAVSPLANPVNDATAVAKVLTEQLKFDTVLLRTDLKLDGLRAALRELSRAARGAEVAALFFAGHGIEQGGRNYLVPVDAKLEEADDLALEALDLDSVRQQIGGATALRLVILDACRNSPFRLAGSRRSATRGLARVEAESNELIAYAAKEGTTADDGRGQGNSPFTAALLRHIATPGLDVRFLFGRVSTEVATATRGRQQPYTYGQLGGDPVMLLAPLQAATAPSAAMPPATGPAQRPPGAASSAQRPAGRPEDGVTLPGVGAGEQVVTLDIERAGPGSVKSLLRCVAPETIVSTASGPQCIKPGSGASFRDCPDCPEMVVVPAGSFNMGSAELGEKPLHQVAVSKPFAVGKFEVTFAEWDACVAAGGCKHKPGDQGGGRGRRPVVEVSWADIDQDYLPWLRHRSGKTYRLLSEAEWEYAARAATTTAYSWGDVFTSHRANVSGRTVDVGQFAANPWGLHDMHGNAWEWVEDCWHDTYVDAPNESAAWLKACPDALRKVIRSGAWYGNPKDLRSARRGWNSAAERGTVLGFRVARALTP